MNYNEYTEEEMNESCDHIFGEMICGRSVNDILKKDENMPSPKTFYKWLREHEHIRNNYTRASEDRADAIFEEVKVIAQDTQMGENQEIEYDKDGNEVSMKVKRSDMTQHRKLQIDTYKWMLGKMKPKKYGDKIDVTSGDKPLGNAIAVTIVPPKDDED